MISHIDTRKLLCFDGLHYSFETMKYFYAGLYEACVAIPKDRGSVIPALASCWGFIDALHRVREISLSTPGINSRSAQMRSFLVKTELAEKYRHYIQHLRCELARNPPNTSPVWGSLSWIDGEDNSKCHTAMFGAQIEGTSVSSCVYDTFEKKWVSKVCLSIGDNAFNFDPIYSSAMGFKDFIIPTLVDGAPDEVKFHDKLPILTMSVGVIKSA